MPVYRTFAAAAALLVLVTVAGLALVKGGSDRAAPDAAAGHRSGQAGATAPSGAVTHATGSRAGNGAASSAPTDTDTKTDGAGAAEGGPAAGAEMPSEGGASPYRLPGVPPAPDASTPLLEGALPAAASGHSALVTGYPARVLPVAPRSTVSTNSISPAGDLLQVTLVATRSRGTDALLRFYRVRLTGLGFTEQPTRAVGGSTAVAFERGRSSVLLTVNPARPTSYSVFATLAAGAS